MYSKFIKLVVLLSLLVCCGFAGRVLYSRFFFSIVSYNGKIHVTLRRKAIEQNLNLEGLLKAVRSMETANERTSEIEKQQSHSVGRAIMKQVTTERRIPMVHLRLDIAILNVVYVVEVIHIEEFVLLKAKSI